MSVKADARENAVKSMAKEIARHCTHAGVNVSEDVAAYLASTANGDNCTATHVVIRQIFLCRSVSSFWYPHTGSGRTRFTIRISLVR